MQGGLISPALFNLIVDNVVWNWLVLTVEDQMITQEGLGLAVGRCLGIFYGENSVVVSRGLEWLQGALNVLIGLFHRYILVENVANSKAMTFHPGTLRCGTSEEAVGKSCTGRGVEYRERLRRQIPCQNF